MAHQRPYGERGFRRREEEMEDESMQGSNEWDEMERGRRMQGGGEGMGYPRREMYGQQGFRAGEGYQGGYRRGPQEYEEEQGRQGWGRQGYQGGQRYGQGMGSQAGMGYQQGWGGGRQGRFRGEEEPQYGGQSGWSGGYGQSGREMGGYGQQGAGYGQFAGGGYAQPEYGQERYGQGRYGQERWSQGGAYGQQGGYGQQFGGGYGSEQHGGGYGGQMTSGIGQQIGSSMMGGAQSMMGRAAGAMGRAAGAIGTMRGRFFGRSPQGYTRSDERIREDVCDLMMQGDFDPTNVSVKVESGQVTLEGQVDSRHTKYTVEEMAETVLGVKDVDNRLRVRREPEEGMGMSAESQKESQQAIKRGTSGGPGGMGRT